MIRLSALLLLLGSISAQDSKSTGSWELQKDLPSIDLHDLDWIDSDRCFVVGDEGTVLVTRDSGRTWEKIELDTQVDLRSVDFAPGKDSDCGWIIGGIPVDATESDATLILRTEDGGKSWKGQSTGIYFPPTRVRAIDAKRGWIVWGLGKFHPDGHWNRTSDGGRRWGMPQGNFYRPGRALLDIFFIDDKFAWGVGSNSLVSISINGKGLETPIAGKGKLGGILHTKDGGDTWELQKADSPKSSYFTSVFFVDSKRGWVTDDAGNIFSTTDTGGSWVKRKSGVASALSSIWFRDEKTGWAVGAKGVILATTDGGETWTREKSGTENDLARIAGASGGRPWIVGKGGVLMRFVERK